MILKTLSALLIFSSQAMSQWQGPVQQNEEAIEIRNLGQCGLVTRYASSQIGDTCLQEAENVYLDEDIGIVRRRGFPRFNATALTASQSVRGIWPFRATDGTDYMVVLSSNTMFQSNGDGTFAAVSPAIASLSATQNMDCTQCLGRLWCVNGSDTMFFWTGTATGTASGAPTCQAIDCFRNRIVLSNCSGTLSQLRMSGELDGTDYTIPSSPVSTSPASISIGGVNDGNEVRCIQGVYQDVLVMGKENSTWGLYGFDRRDFAVREISREVGCIDNRSSREKQGSLYWLSKRGLEKMTGPSITRVSDPIRDLMDTIIVAGGNSRSAQDTSQADFEAGNLTASGPGAPVSATISPGNVVPSTATRIDTSSANFSEGTLTNLVLTDVVGSVVLDSSTFQDNFNDGNFTSNPAWTVGGNDFWSIDTSRLKYDGNQDNSDLIAWLFATSVDSSSGSWSYNVSIVDTFAATKADFVFSSTGSDPATTNGYLFRTEVAAGDGCNAPDATTINHCSSTNGLYRIDAGSLVLLSSVTLGATSGTPISIVIKKSAGTINISINSSVLTATDSTYATSANIILRVDDNIAIAEERHGVVFFDNISWFKYHPVTGSFTSRIFDVSFSSPIWSTLSSTFTAYNSSGEGNIAFYIQVSTDSDDTFDALVSSSDTLKPSIAAKRYFRYRANFSTLVSTKTPQLDAISLDAATTGYFISQCRNPGTAITSWGLFQCNRVLNNGDMTFYVSTGTSCNGATRSTNTWTTQTNNSVITIATAAFVAYRVLFDIDSGTETPTLNDCTINWNEGATRPAIASEVYRDRYYMSYTSATVGTVVNDRLLVLDSRDQWVTHDSPNCSALSLYNRNLYCGDSGNNGRVYRMDTGQDDDGASFTSNIRTKDFDFGNTWQRKVLSRMYFDLSGLPSQDVSISLTPSYTLDASTDVFTLTAINLNEDYSRFIAAKVPALLSNNVTGRWFNFALSHTGVNGPWKLFGMKLVFSRLAED